MSEEKSEVTMSRKEYDTLMSKASGSADVPSGDGSRYDARGFKTVDGMEDVDLNGDGHISKRELEMHLEFKRKELEDADAMRDAQRKMTWFALFGLLLYPFSVVLADWIGLDGASKILGDMAATYFVSVAAIVAAFFGGQAYTASKK
jgi:hypothetical protein